MNFYIFSFFLEVLSGLVKGSVRVFLALDRGGSLEALKMIFLETDFFFNFFVLVCQSSQFGEFPRLLGICFELFQISFRCILVQWVAIAIAKEFCRLIQIICHHNKCPGSISDLDRLPGSAKRAFMS